MISAEDITGSADYFVQDVDAAWQASLVQMRRLDYDRSSFLDGRIQTSEQAQRYMLSYAELNALFAPLPAGRSDYIFHVSHVGSTLISKALGVLPQLLSLREPLLLRWLAQQKLTAGKAEGRMDKPTHAAYLATALKLLSRSSDGSQRTVVKATSFANTLAGDILTMQPEARAIAIYVPLETFLATILKGRGGWLDMLNNATVRLERLHAALGYQRWRLAAMSPGEIVAMNWLSEMLTLGLVSRAHQDRVHWVDFDIYLSQPAPELAGMAKHIGSDWAEQDSEALQRSGLMARYSKTDGVAYDASSRQAELATIRSSRADDIASGMAWMRTALHEHPALSAIVPTLH